MLVRLIREDPRFHRMEVWRDGALTSARRLETRSVLLHDLCHYAVESELQLDHGFFGRLAAGAELDQGETELVEDHVGSDPSNGDPGRLAGAALDPLGAPIPEGLRIERLAAILQSGASRGAPAEELIARLASLEPVAIDSRRGARVLERLRRLRGQWAATPFGVAMPLPWPAPPYEER